MNRKASALRELGDQELRTRLNDAHRELFNLRFQHFTRQLANYQRLGDVRREIARIQTILNERELANKQ